MAVDAKHRIVMLLLVAGRKQKDALLKALSEEDARLISTIYGKGTVQASYLQNVLGLVPEKDKAIITSLLSQEKADIILEMLVEKFGFNKPNTGVAFTVPLHKLSF